MLLDLFKQDLEQAQTVEDLKKLMAKFINEGRSTVGKSQKNDPTPKGWKNVSHFESYLKIN